MDLLGSSQRIGNPNTRMFVKNCNIIPDFMKLEFVIKGGNMGIIHGGSIGTL